MASITIRNLDDSTKRRLRTRAAQHGLSMEEEARRILRDALDSSEPANLGEAIHQLFAKVGGVELPEIPRDVTREPPSFE